MIVLKYPLKDREVLGSNLPGVKTKTLKIVLTATLCDALHIHKSLSKENKAIA